MRAIAGKSNVGSSELPFYSVGRSPFVQMLGFSLVIAACCVAFAFLWSEAHWRVALLDAVWDGGRQSVGRDEQAHDLGNLEGDPLAVGALYLAQRCRNSSSCNAAVTDHPRVLVLDGKAKPLGNRHDRAEKSVDGAGGGKKTDRLKSDRSVLAEMGARVLRAIRGDGKADRVAVDARAEPPTANAGAARSLLKNELLMGDLLSGGAFEQYASDASMRLCPAYDARAREFGGAATAICIELFRRAVDLLTPPARRAPGRRVAANYPARLCALLGKRGIPNSGWRVRGVRGGGWECFSKVVTIGEADASTDQTTSIFFTIRGRAKSDINHVRFKLNVLNPKTTDLAGRRTAEFLEAVFRELGRTLPASALRSVRQLAPFDAKQDGVRISFSREAGDKLRFNLMVSLGNRT